jgi:hypothetical protein
MMRTFIICALRRILTVLMKYRRNDEYNVSYLTKLHQLNLSLIVEKQERMMIHFEGLKKKRTWSISKYYPGPYQE